MEKTVIKLAQKIISSNGDPQVVESLICSLINIRSQNCYNVLEPIVGQVFSVPGYKDLGEFKCEESPKVPDPCAFCKFLTHRDLCYKYNCHGFIRSDGKGVIYVDKDYLPPLDAPLGEKVVVGNKIYVCKPKNSEDGCSENCGLKDMIVNDRDFQCQKYVVCQGKNRKDNCNVYFEPLIFLKDED